MNIQAKILAVQFRIAAGLKALNEDLRDEDLLLIQEIAAVLPIENLDTITVSLDGDKVRISFSVDEPVDSNPLVSPFLAQLDKLGYAVTQPVDINPIKINIPMNKQANPSIVAPTVLASALQDAGVLTTEQQLQNHQRASDALTAASAVVDAATQTAREALNGYDENILPKVAPAAQAKVVQPFAQCLNEQQDEVAAFATKASVSQEEKSFFERLELTTVQKVALGTAAVVIIGGVAYYGAKRLGLIGGDGAVTSEAPGDVVAAFTR